MKIIKYRKLSGNQYEVLLENNEKIKLYEDVILKENLLIKKDIEDIEKIQKINQKYAIYETALKYLNHHVVSIKGMYDYLLKKGYLKEDIELALDKLKTRGYLNDAYYVKCYLNDKINLTSDGPLKIKKHFDEVSISYELYQDELQKYADLWEDRINNYLAKQLRMNKKSNYYFKNKMMVNLINLGYDKEMINHCLSMIEVTNQDDLKKKEEEKIRIKLSRKYSGSELERKIKEKLYQKGFFE